MILFYTKTHRNTNPCSGLWIPKTWVNFVSFPLKIDWQSSLVLIRIFASKQFRKYFNFTFIKIHKNKYEIKK